MEDLEQWKPDSALTNWKPDRVLTQWKPDRSISQWKPHRLLTHWEPKATKIQRNNNVLTVKKHRYEKDRS